MIPYALRLLLVASLFTAAGVAHAQHADVLLQRNGNKIAVGQADFDGGSWAMGVRVFARNFASDYLTDSPGFNALSSTSSAMPPGHSALPGSSAVGWDFLPMKIDQTVSNLWYWNGQDQDGDGIDLEDVAFQLAPSHTLGLQGASGGWAMADGSDQLIPGGTIGTTASNGSLHAHRYFALSSGQASVNPWSGIYLIALQAHITTLEPSDPFFIVFGTPGTPLNARSVAVTWVQQRVDTLTQLGIPGDVNGDDRVDAADYVLWRKSSSDPLLYDAWKQNFDTMQGSAGTFAPAAIPEPSTWLASLLAVAACGLARHRMRHAPRLPHRPTMR